MKITINYHSSWTNSFYDKDGKMSYNSIGEKINANENFNGFNDLDNKVKKLKEQSRYPNYKIADITFNTVFGILSRITGDIRRASKIHDGVIYELKDKINFENNPSYSEEVVFLRRSTDCENYEKNALVGIVSKMESSFGEEHFNVCFGFIDKDHFYFKKIMTDILENINDYYNYAKDDNRIFNSSSYIKKISIYNQYEKILDKYKKASKKDKEILKDIWIECWKDLKNISDKDEELSMKYSNIDFGLKSDGYKIYELSCKFFLSRCLYKFLKFDYDKKGLPFFEKAIDITGMEDILEIKNKLKGTGISGVISRRGLFSTKHNIFPKGGPYLLKDGNNVLSLIKKDGDLIINIDANKEEEAEIYSLIYCSSVNSFHLGKKGLAYISNIELIHNSKIDIEEKFDE